jgi:hypothetical protein
MKDLFETPEQQPKEVRKIVKRYEKKHFDLSYDDCRNLVTELEKVGYTCDYGLDSIPVDLRKI